MDDHDECLLSAQKLYIIIGDLAWKFIV